MRNKLLILLFIQEAAALSLSPCGTDSTLEVVSGRNSVAVCSGVAGQSMEWRYLSPVQNIGLGSCPAVNNCQGRFPAEYILSRSSDSEGMLTFNTTQTMNGNITCTTSSSNFACFIDTVIPSEGSCIVEFRRNTTPWSVFSLCNITRAYSARGRYSCQWYQTYTTTQEAMFGSSVSVTQLTQVGDKNFAGSCVLPTIALMYQNEGPYSYKVNLTPGRNNLTATFIGSNEIVRPTPPIINCNNKDFVPENTNITCFCETTNIGKPGGRLKWFRLYATQQPTLVNAGTYDIESLGMIPQTLNRNDDGRLQFRCDVEWAETITGGVSAVRVGYVGLSIITINKSRENLTVMENQTVAFDCSADGRPTSSMSLTNKGNGILIRKDTSPLTHTLPATRCEDTSTYSCLASNGMGKDTTSAASLYVNCAPRLPSDGAPPVPLFELEVIQNQTESKQFDVVAYPAPNKFTFTFIGLTLTENIISSDLRGLILNATCRERQEMYISDCIITAFNYNSVGGFYVVMVANPHGSVKFTFQIAVNNAVSDWMPERDSSMLSQGIGIGIGVTLTFTLILFGVLTIYLWRRKWKLPCVDKTEDAVSSNPALDINSRRKEERTVTDSTDKFSTSYDVLHSNEIGIAAPYSDLMNYGGVREITSGKERSTDNISKVHNDNHVYDNTSVY